MQYYSDHPSIIRIRESLNFTQIREVYKFKQTPKSDIHKLLKTMDDIISTFIDKISPRLVKKSAAILSKPLCDAINNNFLRGIFRMTQWLPLFLLLMKDQTIKLRF